MASFRRKGDSWEAQVRRKGHPQLSKSFDTKREAQAWAASAETTINTGGRIQADRTSVKELFERFRDEVAPTRKGERWEVVRLNFLLRRQEFVGLRLDQCDDTVIRRYRNNRLKQVQPQSVNREMNLIAGVFSHAIKEWGFRAANPVSAVARPAGADRARAVRWTDADIELILAAAMFDENKPPKVGRDFVGWAISIMLETAVRLGELAAIEVRDVNLVGRYVTVRDSKNGDARDVPLSARAGQLLERLVQSRPIDGRLFPVSGDTLGLRFRECRAESPLKDRDLHLHDLRHEAITRIAPKFSNILELSRVTGHRSLQSLRRYYNPTATELALRLDGET